MRCCRCGSQGQGDNLVAAAAALSVVMAQGKTADELGLLAALFNTLGDNLALLALKAPSRASESRCPSSSESQ